MVDIYMGCSAIIDGPGTNEVQTVTITGSPTGGSFTLTYDGQTTAAIAYNATAAALKSALVAATNLTSNDLTVVLASNVYTVTFNVGRDVPQMTATSSLTGGTSPAATVATSTAGGQAPKSFVRSVKLVLGS